MDWSKVHEHKVDESGLSNLQGILNGNNLCLTVNTNS